MDVVMEDKLILKNHLKLSNVGFGVPHPTFELGEQILEKWIDALVKVNDPDYIVGIDKVQDKSEE